MNAVPRHPPARAAYVNAVLLDPQANTERRGGVLTNGESVEGIGPEVTRANAPRDAEIVDCHGLYLAPGLVDLRVHVGEPGFEHKETIATAGRAAAIGGVTSMVCLPDTEPVIDDVAGLEFVARRAREEKLVKIFAYAAATQGLEGRELCEIGLLAQAGAVGFTDGNKAIADPKVMLRALTYARVFDRRIIQHPEEPRLAEGGDMNGGEIALRLGLTGIPREAEVILLQRDLKLVEMSGGAYHAAHVSTLEGIDAIRQAKRRGLDVTCDTAPPYFALTEVDVGDYRTFAKVSPPLRTDTDRRAVIEGLRDGTIDAIASDHIPQDQDTKRVPFARAAPGIVGLETLLPLTLELVHKGELTLLQALSLLTHRPADVMGLNVGRLAPGAPADFILFDAETPWKIDVHAFASKSKNSPFDGRPVMGRCRRTVVDGRSVFIAEDAHAA
jgi:dihydroorotase